MSVRFVNAANLLVCKPSGGFSCTHSTIAAAAIAAAAHLGDTINVGGSPYNEHDFTISKDLPITGVGSGFVTVDAQNKSRVFLISDAATASMPGMILSAP